ncbi:hypothetical protein BDW60DRAFT_38622 [Aspergillus nidulans var. acristatus]
MIKTNSDPSRSQQPNVNTASASHQSIDGNSNGISNRALACAIVDIFSALPSLPFYSCTSSSAVDESRIFPTLQNQVVIFMSGSSGSVMFLGSCGMVPIIHLTSRRRLSSNMTKGSRVIQGCSLGAGERVLDSGKIQV